MARTTGKFDCMHADFSVAGIWCPTSADVGRWVFLRKDIVTASVSRRESNRVRSPSTVSA
jgi:hypothetical protein